MDRTIRVEEYKCGEENLTVIIENCETDTGNYIYSTLRDSSGADLSPRVKNIKFDKENEVFLIQDKIAITEYLTCSLFFYIDKNGNPLGSIFTDVTEEFMEMPFTTRKDLLSGYNMYKFGFAAKFREEIYNKNQVKINNAKKLALASYEG